MSFSHLKRLFSSPRFLMFLAVATAVLGWAKLDQSWRHKQTIIALDARQVESDHGFTWELYDRELVFYMDHNERQFMTPPLQKPTAWSCLATTLVASVFVYRTRSPRVPKQFKRIALTAILMVAGIITLELGEALLTNLGSNVVY